MNLEQLIAKVGDYAITHKLVNWYAGGANVYEINNGEIRDYALIYFSPTGNHIVTENITTYSVTIYYIDRLVDDLTNDTQIFSTGIEVLKQIIRGIGDMDGVLGISNSYSITNFTETLKMADKCAGAYATLEITVMNDNYCA